MKLNSLMELERGLVQCSVLLLTYCNYANYGYSIKACWKHRAQEGRGRERERERKRGRKKGSSPVPTDVVSSLNGSLEESRFIFITSL